MTRRENRLARIHGASLALILVCLPAFAQPETPFPAALESPMEDAVLLRDPFWPVGWRPPRAAGSNESAAHLARWADALRQLQLTGLSRKPDGSYIAYLRGAGVVEKGDVVSVRYDSLTYRWRVIAITAEGLVPEPIDVSKQ